MRELLLDTFFVFKHAQAAAEASNKPVVFVEKAKATDLFDLMIYPARVVPTVNTTILAETDGIISKLHTSIGQKVLRGRKLMTVKHTDPVYQYAPVAVTAPVSGVVSLVEVTEGSQVSRGQRLASVTDPGKVKIAVEIPGQDVSLLGKGMVGEFLIDGQKTLPVQIHGISPFVDPATGTASCEVELMNKDRSPLPLAPGLIGQVSFKAGIRKGISIPDFAVFFKGSDPYVRILENGKAKQVAVRLGKKQRGFVEVTNGISDNATLIQRASRFVADGEEVTVQGGEAQAGAARK